MKTDVEDYFAKTEYWRDEQRELRKLLLKLKLSESIKWGKPCYSNGNANIAIIQPFKNFLGLMYFKGKLLKDPKKILVSNGPNSQSACRLEFRSVEDVKGFSKQIKAFTEEAIALENSGAKVTFKKRPEALPSELKAAFAKEAKLKAAFFALTPGRQRGYILHISSAKQSETRVSRINKCKVNILKGKGIDGK